MKAAQVAEWMFSAVQTDGTLYQDVAVSHIADKFGADFVITNSNGNQGIRPDVLAAFNKLTPDFIWSRSGRFWRRRESFDMPGRQQP